MTDHLIPDEARPAWRDLAELLTDQATPCQMDADAWFADDPGTRDDAAEACQHCPVRVFAACATYADAAGERWGVWAGIDRGRRTNKRQEAAA